MSIQQILGIIAGIIMIVSIVPYLRAITRQETVPNRVTWIIFTTVGVIAYITYKESGAKETLWMAITGITNPAIIFLFSLKYGVKVWTRLDVVCLTGAVASIVAWKIAGKSEVGLTLCLVTDVFGVLPTLRKVYKDPATEDFTAWFMFFVASAFNVAAIQNWIYGVYVYPLYSIVAATAVTWPLIRYKFTRARVDPVPITQPPSV